MAELDFSKAFDDIPSAGGTAPDFSKAFEDIPDQPRGALANAVAPITSYPATYDKMQRGARSDMAAGVDQVKAALAANPQSSAEKGQAALDFAGGVGKTALGGLGYVVSPISAAVRSAVGQPVENITGIPKEYTEFAASLALPIPKRIPTFARAPQRAAPAAITSEDLAASSNARYKTAREMKVEFDPNSISNTATRIENELFDKGFAPDNSPLTLNAVRSLQSPPAGAKFTGADLERVRQRLVKATQSPTADAGAAHDAINTLDNYLADIPVADVLVGDAKAVSDVFKEARADWAAHKRTAMVEGRQELGKLNTDTANSGMNADNNMRQAVKSIIRPNMKGISPAERAGFNEEELAQARLVAAGSPVRNAVRHASNMMGGGGGFGSLYASVTGASAGHAAGGLKGAVIGAMTPAVGHGLRLLAGRMTGAEASQLAELVASRSPLGRQIEAPMADFSTAARAAEVSPNFRNMARLTMASRNLSTNLSDAGITISPNDIMRSLQGPVKGSANEEQP